MFTFTLPSHKNMEHVVLPESVIQARNVEEFKRMIEIINLLTVMIMIVNICVSVIQLEEVYTVINKLNLKHKIEHLEMLYATLSYAWSYTYFRSALNIYCYG